ncbi:hypothetical protein K438DRAFT_1989233 [Mycena galopus ATCC 62051]|nr:hypothetical protein K438DRAFT_1989233 [Mycena galopus ATCC 62051]
MYDRRKAHQIFDFIDPTWALGFTALYPDDDEEGDGEDKEGDRDLETPRPTQTCIPPIFILKTGDNCHIPVWPNPPKIKKTSNYEFCPKDFRSTIVEMYHTHMHQHPHIPRNDPEEPYLEAEEIHQYAVKELYDFCFENDLSVRARAACSTISLLKKTMTCKSLWKHIKHRNLAQFNHPRLNLVTHLILTALLPRMRPTLDYVHGVHRIGRPLALASWQEDAKADWVKKSWSDEHRLVSKLKLLKSASITKGRAERLEWLAAEHEGERGTYTTDISNWVCPCESFFKGRFLMCKHLIREANTRLKNKPLTDLAFFLNLRQNHFPPYYTIPGIHTTSDDSDSGDVEMVKDIVVLGVRGAPVIQRPLEVTQSSPEVAQAQPSLVKEVETVASSGSGEERDQGRVAAEGGEQRREDSECGDSDAESDGRIMFSEARILHLKRCFNNIFDVMGNERGAHRKMAKVLEGVVGKIEKVDGDIGENKRRRTNPRTWIDHNRNRMYFD